MRSMNRLATATFTLTAALSMALAAPALADIKIGSTLAQTGPASFLGDPEANKVLSLERAQAIFNYFVTHGLNKKIFEVIGLGGDFPIADNDTPQGQKKNRRVVLIRVN